MQVGPTLQQGSPDSEAVKELQRALQRAGFDPGPIDGDFGSVTARAVRSFQTARGLVADGIVGPPTWCALPSEEVGVRPTLQEGSSGEAVKEFKRALQRAGFDPGPIDDDFESVTAEAVRSFQAARGLAVVGIVGPQTWSALIDTFYVHNGHLHDSSGECVVLRGVNKMAVWDQDPTGRIWFPQIRRTGANVVRIVWLMDTSAEPAATVSNMDKAIQNCRLNNMIPMIELHDATMVVGDPATRGGWTKLPDIERFWTRADVTSVLKKHQRYLLLNIANEAGDDSITDQEFKDQYQKTIGAIREAGINVPLVIDAAGWGQKFDYIYNNASYLIDKDPQQNLIFSLHVWWHYGHPDAAGDFKKAINDVVAERIPFIVGEFSGVCQECDNDNNDAPMKPYWRSATRTLWVG